MDPSLFDLLVIDHFFDAELCRRLIDEMRHSPVCPALTYGKSDSGLIDERIRKAARLKPSSATVEYVTERLADYREKIENHFGIGVGSCEEPQFLCYGIGDFFVAHQDGNTGLVRLATDESRRVSVSIFLNNQSEESTAETYGGGALVFSDWRSGGKYRLAEEAGTLVAFRSELTHEVLPVTQGERYSIVSWYGSRE